MKVTILVVVAILFFPSILYAQNPQTIEASGLVGLTGSALLGERGPSVTSRGSLRIDLSKYFHVENRFTFSPIDKYTNEGWYFRNHSDVYIFPFERRMFILTGFDFDHRNGGPWTKKALGFKIGGGYTKYYEEKKRDRLLSLWYRTAFKEIGGINHRKGVGFHFREDTSLRESQNWKLRIEVEIVLVISEHTNRPKAPRPPGYYSNTFIGVVYRR